MFLRSYFKLSVLMRLTSPPTSRNRAEEEEEEEREPTGMRRDVKAFQMKGASEEAVGALTPRLKGSRRLLSGSRETARGFAQALKHLCRLRFKQTLPQ